MQRETVDELTRLARGDSYAAFKSAAEACGLTPGEAEAFYAALDEGLELDVREAGAELRDGETWLTSTVAVDLEDQR
jgi:hypothetical protein